jgi:hypothetical protein
MYNPTNLQYVDVKVDETTRTKLEEQGITMKIYEEKILKLETKISSIPAEQPSVSVLSTISIFCLTKLILDPIITMSSTTGN